jgi:hypothetical protein
MFEGVSESKREKKSGSVGSVEEHDKKKLSLDDLNHMSETLAT